MVVPGDFPTDVYPSALAGSQTKFSARVIDGKYVVGLTPAERSQHYLQCLDLLNQLTEYTQRKLDQKPEAPRAEILDDIVKRIPLQGWALSTPELEWIAKQLTQSFASK
uniref:Uncharacterized protein n=1 Tax=Curvibacter symbiont subsp. Hydra magnipapillata TaxID=667019 RepID=C9YFB5_CURXX|nr:hypothetical protein Csp_D32710 [Curvibacter putative symbiont of Hydra magnipapillata]